MDNWVLGFDPGFGAMVKYLLLSGFARAVSSAVEHCLHTAGATGSIPVSPTMRIKGLRAIRNPYFLSNKFRLFIERRVLIIRRSLVRELRTSFLQLLRGQS